MQGSVDSCGKAGRGDDLSVINESFIRYYFCRWRKLFELLNISSRSCGGFKSVEKPCFRQKQSSATNGKDIPRTLRVILNPLDDPLIVKRSLVRPNSSAGNNQYIGFGLILEAIVGRYSHPHVCCNGFGGFCDRINVVKVPGAEKVIMTGVI